MPGQVLEEFDSSFADYQDRSLALLDNFVRDSKALFGRMSVDDAVNYLESIPPQDWELKNHAPHKMVSTNGNRHLGAFLYAQSPFACLALTFFPNPHDRKDSYDLRIFDPDPKFLNFLNGLETKLQSSQPAGKTRT